MTRRRSRAELPAPEDGALLLGQPLAVVNKTDGDRTHVYRPLAQPGLVGSNCAVGEPAPQRPRVFWGISPFEFEFDTASTLDGTIWGRFMAIGPYGVSPFLMRSLHTVYPAVDLAEKPRIGV